MDSKLLLHSAGATVVHRGRFADIEISAIKDAPPADLVNCWIKPLYMGFFDSSSDSVVAELWSEMNYDKALALLSYFNWRPRIVGAYIVALKDIHELTEQIGKLLLRSDVCYAGRGYCLALARLNTAASRAFLYEYLDYYLTQHDLWFDQACAMGAVACLDQVNGTRELSRFIERWEAFICNKSDWNLAQSISLFSQHMARVKFLAGRDRE
jgi:hypothetical protein